MTDFLQSNDFMHNGLYNLHDCKDILCVFMLHSMKSYSVNHVIIEGTSLLQSGSICTL